METTLVILKPSAVLHGYVGQIVQRFQQKGLVIRGMKMMQLGEPILREHYAHLTDRPFFPDLLKSMMASAARKTSFTHPTPPTMPRLS